MKRGERNSVIRKLFFSGYYTLFFAASVGASIFLGKSV
jgi:hypothetical protein